jgi:hypothetical protein
MLILIGELEEYPRHCKDGIVQYLQEILFALRAHCGRDARGPTKSLE